MHVNDLMASSPVLSSPWIIHSNYKAMSTFLNPGELFITEEWTYPSALATAQPLGVSPVPVAMDGEGMRSDALKELLAGWDENKMGAKRYVRLFFKVF